MICRSYQEFAYFEYWIPCRLRPWNLHIIRQAAAAGSSHFPPISPCRIRKKPRIFVTIPSGCRVHRLDLYSRQEQLLLLQHHKTKWISRNENMRVFFIIQSRATSFHIKFIFFRFFFCSKFLMIFFYLKKKKILLCRTVSLSLPFVQMCSPTQSIIIIIIIPE